MKTSIENTTNPGLRWAAATARTFVGQVPDPQRLVPRRRYEREGAVLREDQVPHHAFVAVEVEHGLA